MTDDISTREKILYEGARLTSGDRNRQYGPPVTNMQDIAALWNTYMARCYEAKFDLSGEDVAHMMALMKIARSFYGTKPDNYVDAATYVAIAGECAEQERGVDGQ